jgi:hypothetical protein
MHWPTYRRQGGAYDGFISRFSARLTAAAGLHGRSSLNHIRVVQSHQHKPFTIKAEACTPMGGKEKGSWRRVQAKTAVSSAQITQLVKMQERA